MALRAIAICSTCPIRPECRDYGIANENHGIWGGYPVDPVVRRAIFVRYRWKVATVRRRCDVCDQIIDRGDPMRYNTTTEHVACEECGT